MTTPTESKTHSADPPKTHTILTGPEALVYWVTALQTIADYDLPRIMVRNYAEDDEYTELDLWEDDAGCLIDGTWLDPVLIPADEDENEYALPEVKAPHEHEQSIAGTERSECADHHEGFNPAIYCEGSVSCDGIVL